MRRLLELLCTAVLVSIASGVSAAAAAGDADAGNPGAAIGGDAPRPSNGLGELLRRNRESDLGSFYLKLRPRFEYANRADQADSTALTARGHLGFATRRWRGFSFLVEGASVLAASESAYFDGTRASAGRALIADPVHTGLNQLYVEYAHESSGTRIRLGRQRIRFDDGRIIGNVGWRQTEQTFDAALFSTGFGSADWKLHYVFVDDVNRIFGDQGRAATRDFASTSHLAHLAYRVRPGLGVSAFAYQFDFANEARFSTRLVGLRASGRESLGDDWALRYTLLGAWQRDHADNPRAFDATLLRAEAGFLWRDVASAAIGFEVVGSDHGRAAFRLPLATAHLFNGFSDTFVDNGGPNGLRDVFVAFGWSLPRRTEFYGAIHRFSDDARGRTLGFELDAEVTRSLNAFVSVGVKAAYFDSRVPERPDTLRFWLFATIEL